jgi:hypothetical protein
MHRRRPALVQPQERSWKGAPYRPKSSETAHGASSTTQKAHRENGAVGLGQQAASCSVEFNARARCERAARMVRSCLGQRTTAIKRWCNLHGGVVHQVPCRGRVTVAGAALARTYVVLGVISGRCRASPVMRRADVSG